MDEVLRVQFFGPLRPFVAGFATELLRQGYAAGSARAHVRLMAHLSRWLADEEVDPHGLRVIELRQFLESRLAVGRKNHLTEKAMRPVLKYLRSIGAVPDPPVVVPEGPVEEVLDHYRRYLTIERGLAGCTARGYVDAVRPFVNGRRSTDEAGLDLKHLSAADVRAFVVARCQSQSRGAATVTVKALRSFLRFIHVEGLTERPLTVAVPSIAGWQLAGLPKGLDVKEVRRLLASCDRRTRQGRRDFAILSMLSRLGLRSGEVAALLLENIDWRAGTFVVCGKGNQTARLPLPTDVGEAVASYLRRGRPKTAQGRTVFVRAKAPHRRLTSSGLSQVVLAAARRAGLGRIFARRLRHTVATQVLRAGALLPEVGQLLGHRRALTTAIYAKVDREALRTLARSWPGGVA
jgi:integrase/recombinase XerD